MKIYNFILIFLAVSTILNAQESTFGFDQPENELSPQIDFAAPTLNWKGEVFLRTRGFELAVESLPRARLNLEGTSGNAQVKLGLMIDPETLAENPKDTLVEAKVQWSSDMALIEAGLLKPVWGRADGLRVLDILTPMDRRDFIHPEVIDQKIAQPMVRAVWNSGESFKAEVAWTPLLEGDRLPTTGRWVPYQISNQLDSAYAQFYSGLKAQYESQVYAAAFTKTMANTDNNITSDNAADAEVLAQQSSIIAMAQTDAQDMVDNLFSYPEPFRWENSQAGIRLSGNMGSWDWGSQYWYGYLRSPSYDANPAAALANNNQVALSYDRVHHFGLDGAFNLFSVALRVETALDLTTDTEGTDRLVHNPTVAFSLGIDKELFGVNAVLEGRQRFILLHEKITDAYDVEKDVRLTDSLVLFRLSQNLSQDTIAWELTSLYGMEDVNAAVTPKITWKPGDFELQLSGHFYLGRDALGVFSQFYEQNFGELIFKYRF